MMVMKVSGDRDDIDDDGGGERDDGDEGGGDCDDDDDDGGERDDGDRDDGDDHDEQPCSGLHLYQHNSDSLNLKRF